MHCFYNYYYQIEIIKDLPVDKTITVYRCGPLVDLCRGPHIPNTSFVKAFACLKVMCYCSAYRYKHALFIMHTYYFVIPGFISLLEGE
jgi:threonyl-tRNA synthetase